jgi:hypothetical protein
MIEEHATRVKNRMSLFFDSRDGSPVLVCTMWLDRGDLHAVRPREYLLHTGVLRDSAG